MAGATETLEHMEHVAHAGGGGHGAGGSTGKYIGITMACLGVLLAFCSALVGGERTELIKSMVEQGTAQAKYQSQSIKYRMVVSQLQALTATIPGEAELAAADKSFDKLEPSAPAAAELAPAKPGPAGAPGAPAVKDAAKGDAAKADVGKADASGETRATIAALRVATRQIVRLIAPTKESVIKAAQLVHKYRLERDAASEWIEAFDPAIHGHTEAAEHYEWSQLCSEIGIVIASIALLFSSRKVWGVALVLGAAAVGILGWTHQSTHAEIEHAEHRIEETGKKYKALRKAQDEKANDEELVRTVSAMYGITMPAAEPAPAGGAEHGGHGGHEHPKE